MGTLRTYWNYGKEFTSIEHCSKGDKTFIIYTLTAIKKKGEYHIKKTFKDNSVKNVANQLNKNQHIILNITGSQVLIRATGSSENDLKTLGSAFPNLDINEFYYQILRTSSQCFVALCRKEYVEETLKLYKATNLEIIGFSLGFYTIQHLINFFPEQVVQLAGYSLKTNEKEIISFEKNDIPLIPIDYLVDDTSVSSDYLLPLSGLFGYEGTPANISSNFSEKNTSLKKDQTQKVFFRKGLWVGSTFLLVILLLNFIFFTNYYSEYQRLNDEYQVELIQKGASDEKIKTIIEKEKLITKMQNNGKSGSSFYLNRIIVSKPLSIVLNEFTYQPLKGQIKENESIKLIHDQILISGESADDKDFSAWLKSLEEMAFINKVEVAKYSYKSKGVTEFRLMLNITPDESKK